jgi:outer membrane protein TolC
MCRAAWAARVAPLVICFVSGRAAAGEACDGPLRRADVVRCALAVSLDVRHARSGLKIAEARRIDAGVLLPTNPIVAGQAMGRVGGANPPGTPTVEWQVSLSQEIEVAGQRGARRTRVDAQIAAQKRRVVAAEQEVSAASLRAYFEAVAAEATLSLTDELARTSDALAYYADERAKESLIAPIDAHVVRAEAVRVGLLHANALERRDLARAMLATLLAQDDVAIAGEDLPTPVVQLEPTSVLVERGLTARADLGAAEMERHVAEREIELLRRTRAPNPTLGVFTGVNVLGEQELGGTLSFPIPLPAPVGRTNAGPIAEAAARGEQAQVEVEQLRRRIRLEVAQAVASERARAAALTRFSPSLLQQARSDLQALRDGITSRQLSVRDALVAERTLIELLVANVDTRLAYAQAWVQLKRATGDLGTEVRR